MIDKKQLIEELLECVKDATDTETKITGLSMCAMLMNEVLDEALTIPFVVSSADFEKPTFQEMREEVLSNKLWSKQDGLYRHFKWGTKTLREAYKIAKSQHYLQRYAM